MKTATTMVVVTWLLAQALPAPAHEGGPAPASAPGVAERAEPGGLAGVEGSVVVPGRVEDLRPLLLDLSRWPEVFSDVRGVGDAGPAGIRAIDFRRFGHPHAFRVVRNGGAVVLELAHAGHGAGRLEYRLAPLDATRSRLTARYAMAPPPGATRADALALLRGKAAADLADFARAASSRRAVASAGRAP